MRIAINGIGIAGPTLAYWLARSGHEVLLIEAAPQLRGGGYVIDFWGVGFDIAEKMGLIPRLLELGYQVEEVRFVDQHGRRRGGFSTEIFQRMTQGRFTSLRRSDLSATIYAALDRRVETLFNDSIAGIEEQGSGVCVSFDHASPRNFDLVIGADGLHSRVRELVFGPEKTFEKQLGYHAAAFEVKGYRPRDELVYLGHGVPGKQIFRFSMRDDRTLFLFVFLDRYLAGKSCTSNTGRKATIGSIFGDVEWECPRIFEAMADVEDIYFDCVSQIHMANWTKGRTALVGDAAACVSLLAGEGTGLAMAEAYVLAGELHRGDGNPATAFARYEALLMPFLARKQQAAAKFAPSFAPQTAFGIKFRNLATRLMRLPFVADLMFGQDLRDDIELPDYRF
jgi:2-polyprenyl-6-methoxyphenol hydroxylase-like FAD-dependent oxidoreductase